MNNYIAISSQGEVETKAFTLLGASSKRSDESKIGQWGSGLKYAIAYLLRNKINFKVFSGYREIVFSLEKDTFRNSEVEIICVNGEKTSMTTEMGFDWKPWFVLREIICNAIDEGEYSIEHNVKNPIPIEDNTVFYIENDRSFQKIFDNWTEYFCLERKDIVFEDTVKKNTIYYGGKAPRIYRKGIVCYDPEAGVRSVFHYNLNNVDINESRIVSSEYMTTISIRTILMECSDLTLIQTLLDNIVDSYEAQFYWSGNFNDAWLTAIDGRILVPLNSSGFWAEIYDPRTHLVLPDDLVSELKKCFGNKIVVIGGDEGHDHKSLIPTEYQKLRLEKAIEFLNLADFKIPCEINLVSFSSTNLHGKAIRNKEIEKSKILISDTALDKGTRETVATIIEEAQHITTGKDDATRGFQNALIELVIKQMELNTKVIL